MNAKRRTLVLRQARLRLGIQQVKKQLVWAAAAHVMGSPLPKTSDDGYALLELFLRTNYTVPAGQIVVRDMPEARAVRKATRSKRRTSERIAFAATNEFLQTFEWRRLRMVVLTKRGPRCECCGAKAPDVRIHVDHIKPRRKYPELALDESNLQVLCEVCNHGKGSWDETDWRPSGTTQGEARGLPIPGTATATSKREDAAAEFSSPASSHCESFMPRLVRRRQEA